MISDPICDFEFQGVKCQKVNTHCVVFQADSTTLYGFVCAEHQDCDANVLNLRELDHQIAKAMFPFQSGMKGEKRKSWPCNHGLRDKK